jgi:cell division protein FtsB
MASEHAFRSTPVSDFASNDEELYDQEHYRQGLTERYLGLSLPKFLVAVFLVLLLGTYIGILLFGDNSLEVLLELEEYESYLQDEISRLKAENANLQKEYFELKELDPDCK